MVKTLIMEFIKLINIVLDKLCGYNI